MSKRNQVLFCLATISAMAVCLQLNATEKPPVESGPKGPQDPDVWTRAVITAVEMDGIAPVIVTMSEVAVTPVPANTADDLRVHFQGEFQQHQATRSRRSAISSAERGEATVMIDFESPNPSVGGPNAPGAGVVAFDGAPATGWIPPDTVLAVGDEYIVEAVNSGFQVYTKTGLKTRAYTDFSSFVHLPTPWNGFCFDPRVVYDPWQDRFVMLILGLDNTNLKSYFWIMVSQTSNPNGDWFLYRFDSTTGDPGLEQWLDFASLGSDPWGVYVVGNSFPFAGGPGFQQSRLWTISREVMSGGTAGFIFMNDLRWPNGDLAFGVQVAQAQSQSALEATYLINNYSASGTEVCLWQLTGDRFSGQGMGATTLNRSAIAARTYFGIFHNVDQPGSDWDIDGGDARIQNAVYAQGKVYTTFALDWDGSQSYSEVYVAAFNTGDGSKAWDHSLWNQDYFMFYPALAVEGGEEHPNWMVAMSMTVPSDPLGYAGTVGVTHDPATNSGSFVWDRQGLGPYSVWDGGSEGVGKNRWGDYSMAVYDWTCKNAWGAAEYATASNSWGTRIFARTLDDEPVCPYVHMVSPNGGETIVAGTTPLVEWSRMNIPTADEVWMHFHTGSELVEYGPMAPGATSYPWTVPNVDAPNAWIEIGAWDTSGLTWHAFDSTDGIFAVTGLADLVHHSMGYPQPVHPGGGVNLSRMVRNLGSVTVGRFHEHLRLSTDTTCTADDLQLGFHITDDLEPDGNDHYVYQVTVPGDTPIGTHYICLILDPIERVPEINEENNIMYRSVEVVIPVIFSDGFEDGSMSGWTSSKP